ncbi:hypothetical protein P691DRAFT_280778 [Macrolepiota fuliginosa MF-IS2]|uniref:Uncharacterized protein n=1 Tax=Macrolepiota fuliginosa MF-IS2 TaxID=1400762 RepID=A0A9P6C172_9AGAR|nr:hypothetical protein P691DRAFT_280778 [Macrolepiota fuliginosa MF-IS2]
MVLHLSSTMNADTEQTKTNLTSSPRTKLTLLPHQPHHARPPANVSAPNQSPVPVRPSQKGKAAFLRQLLPPAAHHKAIPEVNSRMLVVLVLVLVLVLVPFQRSRGWIGNVQCRREALQCPHRRMDMPQVRGEVRGTEEALRAIDVLCRPRRVKIGIANGLYRLRRGSAAASPAQPPVAEFIGGSTTRGSSMYGDRSKSPWADQQQLQTPSHHSTRSMASTHHSQQKSPWVETISTTIENPKNHSPWDAVPSSIPKSVSGTPSSIHSSIPGRERSDTDKNRMSSLWEDAPRSSYGDPPKTPWSGNLKTPGHTAREIGPGGGDENTVLLATTPGAAGAPVDLPSQQGPSLSRSVSISGKSPAVSGRGIPVDVDDAPGLGTPGGWGGVTPRSIGGGGGGDSWDSGAFGGNTGAPASATPLTSTLKTPRSALSGMSRKSSVAASTLSSAKIGSPSPARSPFGSLGGGGGGNGEELLGAAASPNLLAGAPGIGGHGHGIGQASPGKQPLSPLNPAAQDVGAMTPGAGAGAAGDASDWASGGGANDTWGLDATNNAADSWSLNNESAQPQSTTGAGDSWGLNTTASPAHAPAPIETQVQTPKTPGLKTPKTPGLKTPRSIGGKTPKIPAVDVKTPIAESVASPAVETPTTPTPETGGKKKKGKKTTAASLAAEEEERKRKEKEAEEAEKNRLEEEKARLAKETEEAAEQARLAKEAEEAAERHRLAEAEAAAAAAEAEKTAKEKEEEERRAELEAARVAEEKANKEEQEAKGAKAAANAPAKGGKKGKKKKGAVWDDEEEEKQRLAKEAEDRAEQEGREKAEREAREKAEQEAQEKAEQEAKDKAEEARLEAEAKKADEEAQAQAEQDAFVPAIKKGKKSRKGTLLGLGGDTEEKAQEEERLAAAKAEQEVKEREEMEKAEKAKVEKQREEEERKEKDEKEAKEKAGAEEGGGSLFGSLGGGGWGSSSGAGGWGLGSWGTKAKSKTPSITSNLGGWGPSGPSFGGSFGGAFGLGGSEQKQEGFELGDVGEQTNTLFGDIGISSSSPQLADTLDVPAASTELSEEPPRLPSKTPSRVPSRQPSRAPSPVPPVADVATPDPNDGLTVPATEPAVEPTAEEPAPETPAAEEPSNTPQNNEPQPASAEDWGLPVKNKKKKAAKGKGKK